MSYTIKRKSAKAIDKKHSLFWNDGQNKFFILKQGEAFILSTFDELGQAHHIFFTSGDFSSLICEVVKYCLDLPTVARKIPCPTDCSKKLHGCLQMQEAKVMSDGKLRLKLDDRWLEYHNYPTELKLIYKNKIPYIIPVGGEQCLK